MYQFFVEPEQIDVAGKSVIIRGNDVNHIKNVLRMRPGEEVAVSNAVLWPLAVSNGIDGREYRCGILALEEDCVRLELRFIKEDGVELPAKIYLFQGLPKADKMELIIQKAVELGAFQVIPVAMKRCVVKLDEKKADSKIKRWQGIAEAAAKQSKRGVIPTVAPVMSYAQAVKMASEMDLKLVPYELAEGMEQTKQLIESVKPGQRIAIFIGPEGGFDPEEIRTATEVGIQPITLGKRILRTETAGFTTIAWLMYQLEN